MFPKEWMTRIVFAVYIIFLAMIIMSVIQWTSYRSDVNRYESMNCSADCPTSDCDIKLCEKYKNAQISKTNYLIILIIVCVCIAGFWIWDTFYLSVQPLSNVVNVPSSMNINASPTNTNTSLPISSSSPTNINITSTSASASASASASSTTPTDSPSS